MPQFYLAVGDRPRIRDIGVSRMVGQMHFLAPAGGAGALALAAERGAQVVIDSGAYPPNNPARLSLLAYAEQVRQWERRPGFRFALSYDHIGDQARSERDHAALLQRLGGEAPVVPVAQVGATVGEALGDPLAGLDEEERAQALEYGLSYAAGPIDRPAVAVGGMAAAKYSRASVEWLRWFLHELAEAHAHDSSLATVHLLGVGRVELALMHPLVESFDSSGPLRSAGYGWGNIRPNYSSYYGLSQSKLQRSREARLAYFLCQLRDRCELPWSRPNPEALVDDDPRRLYHGARVEQGRFTA